MALDAHAPSVRHSTMRLVIQLWPLFIRNVRYPAHDARLLGTWRFARHSKNQSASCEFLCHMLLEHGAWRLARDARSPEA